MFVPKGVELSLYSCIIGLTLKNTHAMQVFMPYWKFEYTKDVTLHCGKSGGGIDPATEVTHFGLN